MFWGVRCIQARFQRGMHYVHTSSTHSSQVCLVLIRHVQGLLQIHFFFFSTWYLKLARASIMKNCLSSWMCISRCPDSRHALARAEECLRGCGQLLRGVKTLDKSSIYPWWALHGSLTAGNKDTVCERISKEMPSRPVVPGQERTAVSHTAPGSTRCSVLPRGFQHWIISRSLKYRFV